MSRNLIHRASPGASMARSSARRTRLELAGPGARAAAALLVAVMFMGSTLLTPLYALYRREYGFSIVTLTLLYSVYVIGNLAALLLLGRLSDQVGRRPVGLGAIALAGVATLGFLFANSPPWLFAARVLSGLSVGLASGAGAAWIAELVGGQDRAVAATVATSANFFGIAAGPFLAGVLAQYAPAPTRLSFVAYLAVLAVVAVAIAFTPETVRRREPRLALKPRLGVPRDIRTAFLPPAVCIFGVMALVGFYAALIPTVLSQALRISNLAIAGAVASVMFAIAGVVVLLTRQAPARASMLWGLGLMAPAVGLLAGAEAARSFGLLGLGVLTAGAAAALGYRGSLEVLNQLAPADRRAEVTSSYYLVGFAGNALPVIGVGLITAAASSLAGAGAFALTIAIFALAAAAFELHRSAGQAERGAA